MNLPNWVYLPVILLCFCFALSSLVIPYLLVDERAMEAADLLEELLRQYGYTIVYGRPDGEILDLSYSWALWFVPLMDDFEIEICRYRTRFYYEGSHGIYYQFDLKAYLDKSIKFEGGDTIHV